MGIRDRDYMKRPADNAGECEPPLSTNLEQFAASLLKNRARLFLILGILLLAALGLAIFIAAPDSARNSPAN